MGGSPDRKSAREKPTPFCGEEKDAAATVTGMGFDPDEATALQGLERGGKGGTVQREERCDGSHGRWFGAIERHKERELAVGESEGAQGFVEAAPEGPCCTLHVHAEAGVAQVESGLERDRLFAGHRRNLVDINVFGNRNSCRTPRGGTFGAAEGRTKRDGRMAKHFAD